MVPAGELEDLPPPRFRRFFLLPVLVLIAAAVVYAALRPAPADRSAPKVLPEFDLPLLSGGTLDGKDLRGKPLVLNVWASWCAPCRKEAPAFERLWRTHRGHGLAVIGINTQDDEGAARAFVKKFGISYPIAIDRDQELVSKLEELSGISDAWPQTFFIGTDGRLVAAESGDALTTADGTVLGALTEAELEASVMKLFAAAATARPAR